jgi:hypothetical protein
MGLGTLPIEYETVKNIDLKELVPTFSKLKAQKRKF